MAMVDWLREIYHGGSVICPKNLTTKNLATRSDYFFGSMFLAVSQNRPFPIGRSEPVCYLLPFPMNHQQTNSKSNHTTGPTQEFQKRLLVVIATYNEAGNIRLLLESVFSYLPDAQVLVIDDNSPDQTGEIVEEMSKTDSRVHCLHRSGKLGLGSATVEGFGWGLKREFDWILTMDADFSHHPESLVDIFSRATEHLAGGSTLNLDHDASCKRPVSESRISENRVTEKCDRRPWDIVIGSRYVAGGRIEGWPLRRRVASRLINFLTRLTIGLPTRDNSGAFRCYGRRVLEEMDFEEITNRGYGYLQQILFLANRDGACMTEVPITFRDRTEGESKINLKASS